MGYNSGLRWVVFDQHFPTFADILCGGGISRRFTRQREVAKGCFPPVDEQDNQPIEAELCEV